MKKQETMFWMLRTLVRQGKLEPAYARQIYERYIESSGKKIPFGHTLWFRHGWAYDQAVWGNKEAAKDYYDEYKGSPYCPVDKLPSVTGYNRRVGKARVFSPCERKKAERNYLPKKRVKFTTNIDEELLKKIKMIALLKDVGVNDIIEELLEEYLEDL